MYLRKTHNGYYPAYPSDELESAKIKQGAEVKVTRARNSMHNRKMFAILNMYFDNQDKYANIDIARQILTIKAGFVEWVVGSDHVNYPFAKSWAFDKMGQEEFSKMYDAIIEIISKELKLTKDEVENHSKDYL
jgi:hypothetical protein